jgi:hypothetical protein
MIKFEEESTNNQTGKFLLRIKVINNFLTWDCYQPFIKLRVIII